MISSSFQTPRVRGWISNDGFDLLASKKRASLQRRRTCIAKTHKREITVRLDPVSDTDTLSFHNNHNSNINSNTSTMAAEKKAEAAPSTTTLVRITDIHTLVLTCTHNTRFGSGHGRVVQKGPPRCSRWGHFNEKEHMDSLPVSYQGNTFLCLALRCV